MGWLYVDRDFLDRHDAPDGFIRLTRLRLGNQVEHLIAILLTHASAQTILYSYTAFGCYSMSSVVALDRLIDARRVWRGQVVSSPSGANFSTGHHFLDAVLPGGGWPRAALSEILTTAPGIGELSLLWPTLASLTVSGERVVLISPPHLPYPQAWIHAGVDLRQLSIIQADGRDALWAAEQCLRSGSCGAVLSWLRQADDRSLRRLQVAAATGQTLAFAYRPQAEAANPSPAALRLVLDSQPAQLRVIKCRGGLPPAQPLAFAWH